MDVGQIGSRNIVRVVRSCDLRQAAALMRQHHVGALIVTEDEPDDDRAIGFVTDRDIVLHAVAEGLGPEEAVVGDVMTEGLATIHDGADVHTAMETMREYAVRRLVVRSQEGALLGVVSLDDLIDALAARLTGPAAAGQGVALATELETLAGIILNERRREAADVASMDSANAARLGIDPAQ